MLKRLLSPLSLVNQLVLIVLLLAVLGVAALGTASWLGNGIQGSAHAINKAGSLRMQSYRLLAAVPLTPASNALLDEMSNTVNSDELARAASNDHQRAKLQSLKICWEQELAPALKAAHNQREVEVQVAHYVARIDELVTAFDQQTEQRMQHVVMLQLVMALLVVVLFLFTIVWLHKRLLQPWRQLMTIATAVGHRDFTRRAQISGRNEMATLGAALNSMSSELAESYASLEARVAEKTARLEHKNRVLSFLYWANRQLHSQADFCQRVTPVLNELQKFTPLRNLEMRVYEHEDEEHYQEFSLQPGKDCYDRGCQLCPRSVPTVLPNATPCKWRLTDSQNQYGLVLAQLPEGNVLNQDQQLLVETLMEQLTSTLALERHSERQQQLMVMEERSAIARELHDSIAQSLSCMKMQVSCLQMQGGDMPEASRELLGQIRNELNSSWRQLRELLTTFRLQLSEPGLRPALEACCEEFSEKLGFAVTLDYQLPSRLVPSNQAIHLVQIVREALNNTLKHAGASAVNISAVMEGKQVKLSVTDNGCGIPENGERRNHYGLIIMRDRAHTLKGNCQIQPRPQGGTEVCVTFTPDGQSS
ncbi:nitrate/nitrite two-component system sensor histidine kinase NarX [Shimwellia blattae]|uniref:Sensor protein n=1 Tax=Shimwellia blattae (strain ATCC 29907 / DSM 4481 / JCM 1650 / NBRC 105725 / CDC 9005-74) TaxID=630626 RepID=I2B8X4_SHIBC|nr:nitrate/nitrite two-component system sensor histidine kinase NarX [Shimwellia blattae]AFJ46978.1 nitrate/nitrite sensor protein NarX [Shimwellia blattae DSM 4481 = NBRC 105725]GAB80899.1 nitrate/nitrite sensor histidine kinase NarX [Shimwellia blattae DSM 4481 = NBRC 105725]VDY64470.1 Nitrate/nitrite sensor protein narX [Shimwellia blattae]VEC22579.1 Nitrate/nitrite sensor protein narX [Shimwellia blattae]